MKPVIATKELATVDQKNILKCGSDNALKHNVAEIRIINYKKEHQEWIN